MGRIGKGDKAGKRGVVTERSGTRSRGKEGTKRRGERGRRWGRRVCRCCGAGSRRGRALGTLVGTSAEGPGAQKVPWGCDKGCAGPDVVYS